MVGKHVRFHTPPSSPSLSTVSSSLSSPYHGPDTPSPTYPSLPLHHSIPMPPKYLNSPQAVLIHPVLSSPTCSAHLFYDLSMQPSTAQLFSLNSRILSEPATQPPLRSMTVIHHHLPWTITVVPSRMPGTYVSIADLLEAIYRVLRLPATEAQYRQISTEGMRRRVTFAYRQRCERLISQGKEYYEMEKAKGLKRVDFLLGETIFAGLSPSTSHGSDVWRLDIRALESHSPNHAGVFGAQEQDQKGGGSKPLHKAGDGGQDYRSLATLPSKSSATPPITAGEPQSLEDDAGVGEGNLLEDEAGEAAFVVCWPQGRTTPNSKITRSPDDFPCINSSWDGGCILSVHDPNFVDDWIDNNYDHRFLTLLRDKGIGGPIASMISFELPALAIFGAMSVQLIRMADELAELSAFPVIVRPLEEDPSPRFRKHGDGNASRGAGTPRSPPPQSGSQSQGMNNHPASSKRKLEKQHDAGSNDEGDDPSDPPPPPPSPPPPSGPANKGEIIHRADITLTILINDQDKGHFLRVITNAKSFPVPNLKPKSENKGGRKVASEPSIEGHVYLETRSSESIQIDGAAGSVGFLANEPEYLGTEYPVSLGYDQPLGKFKIENTSQVSKGMMGSLGLASGKPTAKLDVSVSTSSSTMTGLTDEEVAKPWIVSPQHGKDNWETTESCYRSLSTNIYRSPTWEDRALKHFRASDVTAEYGMAVEVEKPISEETLPVSFIYRHQIHCWVAVETRAKVRGLIVLTAHYVPDIRTEKPLRLSNRQSLNITCKNINKDGGKPVAGPAVQKGSSRAWGGPSRSNSDGDRFMFSTATMPEPEVGTRTFFDRLLSREPNSIPSGGRKGVGQLEPVPVRGLVCRGWNRKDIGWDHREQRWYHPVWPKLDCTLSPDESKAKWKLDWE